MSLSEICRQFKAERDAEAASGELTARVREILEAGERHTTKSLALRLGRPRDLPLYEALSALLQERTIATDGASCEFYRREEA